MQRKVVNVSLLLVVCVILIACRPSEAERNAQVTEIAASVYETETAQAPRPSSTPVPQAGPPVTPTAMLAPPTATPAIAPTASASPSSPARQPLTSGTLPDNAARELDAAVQNEYYTPYSFTAKSLRMIGQMKGAGTGYVEVESTDQHLPFSAREGEEPTLLPISPSHLKVRGRGDGTDISILNYEEFGLLVQSATNLGDVVIPRGTYLVRTGGSWVLTAQPPADIAAPSTGSAIPPTVPLGAEPTASPVPLSGQVRASADQAFASGLTVYLYDPQPNTVSKADLDTTEFSLRYVLSKDAQPAPNILLLRKVDANGAREFIIPETVDLLPRTITFGDWTSETGTIGFTTSSRMVDTSDQQGGDPNMAVFTTWITDLSSVTPLYGPPNGHVKDPVYLEALLLWPEERDAAQLSSDAASQPWKTVMLLSNQAKPLSNTVRIPITP